MRRFFCIAIIMALFVCAALPMSVIAVSSVWDGTVATSYAGGTGTETDPYQISNGQQLAYLAKQVNAGTTYEGQFFVLTDDIALNDTTNHEAWGTNDGQGGIVEPSNTWDAIGWEKTSFDGEFDGAGHTVSGVYINRNTNISSYDNNSLFGNAEVTSVIKNLGVIDSYVETYSGAAGVVDSSDGMVFNCYCTGSTIKAVKSNAARVVGFSSGTVSGCYSTSTIVGLGSDASAGGIVGYSGGLIVNCYNTGSVTHFYGGDAGGVVGSLTTGKGEDLAPAIRNCYNIGTVSGDMHIGGVIGEYTEGVVEHCYYLDTAADGGADGQDLLGRAEALTAAQLTVQSSFVNWDFENVWGWAVEGDEFYPYAYPILRANPHQPEMGPLYTLGCAARYDTTAIRFGARLDFDNGLLLMEDDVIDYGFYLNGIRDGHLLQAEWIRVSAASAAPDYTGFVCDIGFFKSMDSPQAAVEYLRSQGMKVYSMDDTTFTFAVILNGLTPEMSDSLWVFRPYFSINGEDILTGAIKYNSVDGVLSDVPSGLYQP